MSSHREAPEISKDPVADSTDLYAFVSPTQPDNVVIIANYVPLEEPAGGPHFYSVSRINTNGSKTVLGTNLACPPCNIGPRSTPNYQQLEAAAVHQLSGNLRVFAGQRA